MPVETSKQALVSLAVGHILGDRPPQCPRVDDRRAFAGQSVAAQKKRRTIAGKRTGHHPFEPSPIERGLAGRERVPGIQRGIANEQGRTATHVAGRAVFGDDFDASRTRPSVLR